MLPPLAFILYDSRSGSTLLARKLEEYEGVFVTNESALVSRLVGYRGAWHPSTLARHLLREQQFRDWGLSTEEVEAAVRTTTDVPALVALLARLHFEKRYAWYDEVLARLVVIKHAATHRLAVVETQWPEAKAIVLVRDGRDVFSSKSRTRNLAGRPFARNVVGAALNWRYRYGLFEKTRLEKHRIRYEDLLADSGALDELVANLGVIPRLDPRKRYPIPASQAGLHRNVHSELLRDNTGKFSPVGYVNYVYSRVARRTLENYGYQDLYPRNSFNPIRALRMAWDCVRFAVQATTNTVRYALRDRERLSIRLHKLLPW